MTIIAADTQAEAFKMSLKDLQLHIRKIVLRPPVHAAIERGLQSKPALYPIAHSKITMHSIPMGHTHFNQPHLIRGRLPRHLIFFLLMRRHTMEH